VLELNRRRRTRRWLLAPVGILILLAVAYALAAPRVVSVSPAPEDSQVEALSPVRITFNRPMSRPSVESRLATVPSIAGSYSWEAQTLVFTPESGWPSGETIQVSLTAGFQSRLFLPGLTGMSWQFGVSQVRVAYLLRQDGRSVLVAQPLTGEPAVPLLPPEIEVTEFALAADGQLATFERQAGGPTYLSIRQRTGDEPQRLYQCPTESRCSGLAISPSGGQVAWELRPMTPASSGALVEGEPSVWAWLAGGQDGSSEQAASVPSHSPHWLGQDSLAVYDPGQQALVVLTPSGQQPWPALASIDNSLGEQAAWTPDGRFVVFPEVVLLSDEDAQSGFDFYSHLYRVELGSGLRTDLSSQAAGLVEDASPAFSPDGLWLAFARKFLDAEAWTLGRQLWLMRADGGAPQQLTEAAEVNHAQLAWSPDGRRLAFVRFDPSHPEQLGSVWVYTLETSQLNLMSEGAFGPQWMP